MPLAGIDPGTSRIRSRRFTDCANRAYNNGFEENVISSVNISDVDVPEFSSYCFLLLVFWSRGQSNNWRLSLFLSVWIFVDCIFVLWSKRKSNSRLSLFLPAHNVEWFLWLLRKIGSSGTFLRFSQSSGPLMALDRVASSFIFELSREILFRARTCKDAKGHANFILVLIF